jgi:hypothetical protein
MMRASQFGFGTELTSNLVKVYQKIMLNEKAKTMYLWQLILYAGDYFEYFDQIRRTQTKLYSEKYKDHHRDQIFFLVLLKCLHLISAEETLEALESRTKFNVIRQKSKFIDKDIDEANWAEMMKGSENFRREFRLEFDEHIGNLRYDIDNMLEFLRENYNGLLDPKKFAIIKLALDKKRISFRNKFEEITNRFFHILAATLQKQKMPSDGAALARKIIVLTHYYEKYKNTDRIDWTKAYTAANNLDLDKENEIVRDRAEQALAEIKRRSREAWIYWSLIILVLLVSLILGAFVKLNYR